MNSLFLRGVHLLKLIFFLSLMSIPFVASSQSRLNPTDVRSFSLGNVHALSNEVVNPAALSFNDSGGVGVLVLNQFMMKELNTVSLYGMYPNRLLDAGLAISYYGYEDYQVLQGQVGLSKKVFDCLSIGVNIVYSHLSSILEEEDKSYLFADIGLRYQVQESLFLVFLAENVLRTQKDKLWRYFLGASYNITDDLAVVGELSYGYHEKFNISLGLEYELLDAFLLRGGFHSDAKSPSFGLAYHIGAWQIDAGFSLHSSLGMSSMIGMSYDF